MSNKSVRKWIWPGSHYREGTRKKSITAERDKRTCGQEGPVNSKDLGSFGRFALNWDTSPKIKLLKLKKKSEGYPLNQKFIIFFKSNRQCVTPFNASVPSSINVPGTSQSFIIYPWAFQ